MDDANQNTYLPDEPQPRQKNRYRFLINTLLLAGFTFLSVLLYERISPFIFPDAPGVTLTDIHAIDDLHARFNEAAGQPRLILFVSPT